MQGFLNFKIKSFVPTWLLWVQYLYHIYLVHNGLLATRMPKCYSNMNDKLGLEIVKWGLQMCMYCKRTLLTTKGSKVGRMRICQLWKFERNRRETESKREKNGENKKMQFRHRFDQKCPFTDSLHWLDSHLARTSSVPLEKSSNVAQIVSPFSKGKRNDALQGNLEKKKNARFYFLLLGRLFNIGLQIRLVILKFLRAIC